MGARIAELETAVAQCRTLARHELDHPTGLHATCLHLIWKTAEAVLGGSATGAAPSDT